MKKAIKKAVKKAKEKLARIASWSFSRWSDYEKCPRLAHYKHVRKWKEPDNQYGIAGDLVHKLGEQYLRGQLKKFPREFASVEKEMRDLKARKATPEVTWAFDKEYQSVKWNDWDNVWLRIKVDAHVLEGTKVAKLNQYRVEVVDYKTGKEKSEHSQQASLYAMGAMLTYPEAKTVWVFFWYLNNSDPNRSVVKFEFAAKDLPKFKEHWEQRTRAMLNDEQFAPLPNPGCGYCFLSKRKGGPCEF